MKESQASCLVTVAVVVCVILGLAVSAWASSPSPDALGACSESKPYVIFHLDAISSKVFFEMIDAGMLPNISDLFSEGAVIPYAVSPFMPGTEMVYPRLKRGQAASSDDPIAWSTVNRHTGEWRTWPDNVLGLWRWVPRYALSQGLNGVMGLEWVTALSPVNIRRMLRDYAALEFFWFNSDTVGHNKGIETQKASAARFDAFLRPFADYIQQSPDSVNLVLYCDHGMSMIEEYVDTDAAMAEVAGEQAVLCFYPNLYLADPNCAPKVAQELATRLEVDFAFWREGDGRIVGLHDGGSVWFDFDERGASYGYEGEDPFAYYDLGYRGEWLSDDEWLGLTCRSEWPAAPIQVVRYMQGDWSGDVVVITNPPKGMPTIGGFVARHKGITASDCTVPVLMAGPDISLDPVPESIWLHTLYSEVLHIDPLAAQRASREPNSLMLSPTGVDLTLSPVPSLLLHAELSGDCSVFLCETDPFRSFNARVWIGAGIVGNGSGPTAITRPTLSARLEIFIDRLVIDWRTLRSGGTAEQRLSAAYEAPSGFTVRWSFPSQIGLGLTW